MLKIIYPKDLDEKFSYLKGFNSENETWITSDINSKSFVQNAILSSSPESTESSTTCLPEDAVIRISELWRKIFYRAFTGYEIASRQFISTLLGEWLRERDLPWAQHPGTPNLLLDYMGEFLPALAHGASTAQLRDWLREHPDSLLKWGHWFELSIEAWQHFKKEKILASTWISAFLAGHEWSPHVWGRKLYFDVGCDLVSVEIELIQKLAAQNEVVVFSPSEDWLSKFNSTLWPYQILAQKGYSVQPRAGLEFTQPAHAKCFRFTTQLAEVKAAIAQLRIWLDEGLQPFELGIAAADIESYWPALDAYARKEGVPIAKDLVQTAASLPSMSQWISRLKIESQDIESAYLEQSVYQSLRTPGMDFDKFKQLFNKIYDASDLKRDPQILRLFDFQLKNADRITRDEFLTWALKYWVGDTQGLESLTALLLNECPVHFKLELRSWISYLTGLIAKVEIRLKEGESRGVFCANLDAAQNLSVKNMIFLGLSESALREVAKISVTQNEVQSIIADLGLFLESPDQSQNAFLAEHIADRIAGTTCLYFAASNFAGDVEGPSLFWLQNAMLSKPNAEAIDIPALSRWDEIQQSSLEAMGHADIAVYLSQDLGLNPAAEVQSTALAGLVYSASQIENYLECPFIFMAEKLFYLSDLPDVDLDVDAMTSGKLIHAILEELLAPPLRLERDELELEGLVDKLRVGLALPIGEERLWPSKRKQFVRTAQRFLIFEKEWRAQYPKTQTLGREVSVRGRMRLTDTVEIDIRGKIDRIDTAGDEAVILDYKSSAYNLRNYGSWISQNELQLAFYAIAIEQGLSDLPPQTIVGAFYYVLANMNREKGLRFVNRGQGLYGPNSRNKSSIAEEDYLDFIAQVKNKLLATTNSIKAGHFEALPKDIKTCDDCNWRTVCRAPHLN